MTDVNIRGEWLKLGRSLVFKDGGGVTWSLSNGNEISITAVSGASIPPGSVSNTELADMAQATIKGRAAGAGTGSPQDLTASQVKTILAISLSSDVTGTLQAAQEPAHTGDVTNSAGSLALTIAGDAVTNAKLANMAQSTIKGRAAGAGTGDPTDLTGTQATALLDAFTTSLKGLAPASGGGTTNYLRADGSWSAPPGATSGTVTSVDITQPAAGITATGGPITTAGAITLALANDLAALEGLSSTGVAVRSGTDTWVQRTITGTASRLAVTNGSGVAGNPTLDIDAAYVGQASITTLGTIATGVWQGTGINLSLYASGTLQAAQEPAHTGDVTNSAGSLALTIAAGAVSLAKMANLAANSIIGNNTGSPATPIALTSAQVKTLLAISLSTDVTGTLQAAQEPAHTGDVTNSAGSLALTIANDAVTYAKMQNVSATARLLGRVTAGSGDVEELTANSGLTIQSGGIDDNLTIQTMWRNVATIFGGVASDIFGGVLGLDGGSASTVFTGLQTLDCSANRATA